ncbi:LPS export ABC transporter permease LptG [Paucibacter sp. B2R-40]|jgi:lipopolysaccharide export system permease protein|uniref:LPS export ABC transporter permease LptG n=1 Tax=Paucibacter sp. B2R-40 TaxID=2893554 RepID=UPI0021E4C6FF|nr:LPS export ABC transporter permease LptG [Paucibacter sp. B2R-40]MCV2355464.1 LPS export ABC transporter permease LptG [Paucibacter sp. B2R-40]
MKTVRRLLYRDIVGSVFFVSLAFLSLFFFIDFIDELDNMRRVEAGAFKAALLALMDIPGHFYQLFPIAVLIGSIYSLAGLAQSSEFTILRTGGLGPGRALGLLAYLAAAFAALTFVVGDFAVPYFDLQADTMRARYVGTVEQGRRGAWLKDHQLVDGQERSFSINVSQADASGRLQGVRIFEFDHAGGLISRLAASHAMVDAKGFWRLSDVTQTEWLSIGTKVNANTNLSDKEELRAVRETKLAELNWKSSLHAGVIAAAVLPAASMSTLELYRYTQHLSAQEQSAQVHQIQFWRKAIYPFACFVMVALALPFAYLHGRSGGISLKVFGGIMLGISFVLLNNVAGHVGILRNWLPWLVATGPSLFYLALSLAAFGWLVRYR